MNLSYKTHNIDLTPDVTRYAEEKSQSLEKLTSLEAMCEVLLSRDEKHQSGVVFRADFTVIDGKTRVHAVGHGESIFAALDMAKDELANRLRREKKMHVRVMRKGGAAVKWMMRFGRTE